MVTVVDAKIPSGIRRNNPLNIRKSGIAWEGKSYEDPGAAFETFVSPHHGIRAAARNLLTYYRIKRFRTIQEIVNEWAPPEDDNNTGAYIDFVADKMGVPPDAELNLENPEVLGGLVIAMMGMEIGSVPYSMATIKTAVASAYVGGKPGAPPVQTQPDYVSPTPLPSPPTLPTSTNKPPLVDQPSAAPTNKVTAGSIGAMGGLPVAFVAKVFWDRYVPEQPMPTEIAIAIAAAASSLLSFVIGYYTRNRATPCPPPAAQV
jgi:hypothetical protein